MRAVTSDCKAWLRPLLPTRPLREFGRVVGRQTVVGRKEVVGRQATCGRGGGGASPLGVADAECGTSPNPPTTPALPQIQPPQPHHNPPHHHRRTTLARARSSTRRRLCASSAATWACSCSTRCHTLPWRSGSLGRGRAPGSGGKRWGGRGGGVGRRAGHGGCGVVGSPGGAATPRPARGREGARSETGRRANGGHHSPLARHRPCPCATGPRDAPAHPPVRAPRLAMACAAVTGGSEEAGAWSGVR